MDILANNDWTHIDFAIFNKMDKKMFLAIEVDGYYYHKEGTKQQKRDKLKDRILKKYEVLLKGTPSNVKRDTFQKQLELVFGRCPPLTHRKKLKVQS